MARYGIGNRYDQIQYGASTDDLLLWVFQVDWDNDGHYDTNEARFLQGMNTRRGRQYMLRTETDDNLSTVCVGFELPEIGEGLFYLDNSDGRFDAYNSSSPLYPNVLPGRDLRVQVKVEDTLIPIFAGKIADIQPLERGDHRQVLIRAVDGMELLKESATISLQTGRRADLAVADVIEAIDYPALWGSSYDSAPDFLPYWWAGGRSAREVIRDLCDATFGTFFIAADGKATYHNRYNNGGTPVELDESECSKDIGLMRPWNTVYNRINVTARPLTKLAVQELWYLYDIPQVDDGESFEVWAPYQYNGENVPAEDVADPTATSDYAMNSASDGSGSDQTDDWSVSAEKFATTAKLTFTNNSGSRGYITLAKLNGAPLVNPSPSPVIDNDSASQALYRVREMRLDNPYLQDSNRAQQFASFLKGQFSTPSPTPTIKVRNQPGKQFLDLFAAVDFSAASKGIDGVMQVGYIEHQWMDEIGQDVETRIQLEESRAITSAWIFPTKIGETSIFSF